MKREMVLADLTQHANPFNSQWFGAMGGRCPTLGCPGFERHNGVCFGPNAKSHVSRLYKGDIIGRKVWDGERFRDINDLVTWNLQIHEGPGAYDRAYRDAIINGRGFARLKADGSFKSFYGNVDNGDEHAKRLPQEIKCQIFWRCDHHPSAIDNWGAGIGNCEQCGAGVQLFDANQPKTFKSESKKMRFETATINGDNGTDTGFDVTLTISQRDDGKFCIETPEYALDEVFDAHADAEDYILLSYAAPCWDLRIEER